VLRKVIRELTSVRPYKHTYKLREKVSVTTVYINEWDIVRSGNRQFGGTRRMQIKVCARDNTSAARAIYLACSMYMSASGGQLPFLQQCMPR